ncbi:hypothetical protein [Nocardia vulneris]|uniref:hypothetical protein n=1 Tax=Nocardia vulneris TaxID=1141657 RepID=UPI0012E09718|nr:hypothetical protein [Nocardia vulneris]
MPRRLLKCVLLRRAARTLLHRVPPGFLVRLLWRLPEWVPPGFLVRLLWRLPE